MAKFKIMIKNRVVNHWMTTLFGLIVGLFGLAALWFGKIGVWELIPIVLIAVALIAAKDTILDKLTKDILNFKK